LLDQQFILIQNGRLSWRVGWPRLQAGRQTGAHRLMHRLRLRSQKIAEEIAEEGMRGVEDLPIGPVAEHQSKPPEPFQKRDQLAITEADESAGHLAAGLHDPAEQLYLLAARKQRQAGP